MMSLASNLRNGGLHENIVEGAAGFLYRVVDGALAPDVRLSRASEGCGPIYGANVGHRDGSTGPLL